MEAINKTFQDFEKFSNNPISFLNGDALVSSSYIDVGAALYKFAKLRNKTKTSDPLAQLYTKGFHEEQVWQQIELFNEENITTCAKGIEHCFRVTKVNGLTNTEDSVNSDEPAEEQDDEETENVSELSNNENLEEEEEEEDNEEVERIEAQLEKTEVDDNFFSLRQMEKFLDDVEAEHKQPDAKDDDIDYFNDIPSTDDEDGLSVKDSIDDEGGLSDKESVDDEDSLSMDEIDDKTEKVSARHLKYEDFYSKLPAENNALPVPVVEDDLENNHSQNKLSNHQKQHFEMSKKIKQLEERAVGESDWQMKGEVTADKRPVNSLLEEVLTFNQSQRAAPEITDEHTFDLESMICQRTKDKAWDDVVRKIKEVKNPQEYKQKIVLNSEKSKMSLQEIYEKEYLEKISNEKGEEKEDPAHTELKTLMQTLFKKLDALSNFHFRSAPPDPEIKVITNLPSLAMEEVQPVTHTDADLLAPEEVTEKKELKADLEKTSTDKKRERRKKAARLKARSKAREAKLKSLATTNEKLQTVQAIKQLQQAAKTPGSQTTIIKKTKSGENLTSSKAFFNKLEENKNKPPPKKKKR